MNAKYIILSPKTKNTTCFFILTNAIEIKDNGVEATLATYSGTGEHCHPHNENTKHPSEIRSTEQK